MTVYLKLSLGVACAPPHTTSHVPDETVKAKKVCKNMVDQKSENTI
jgi:hypothetical protein